MATHKYNKRLNGENHSCVNCGAGGANVQHHIGGRRYDDRAIWLCDLCHKKVHNPTAYGLPATWAYDNGYLIRRSDSMLKEKKSKTCKHSGKRWNKFDEQGMHVMCGSCNQEIKKS